MPGDHRSAAARLDRRGSPADIVNTRRRGYDDYQFFTVETAVIYKEEEP